MRFLILFVIFSLICFSGLSKPLITGAFIQLDSLSKNYTLQEWEREIGYMSAIGIDTILIQYSRYGETFYFPSKYAVNEKLPDESLLELSIPINKSTDALKIQIPCTSREWTLISEVRIISESKNIAPDSSYTFDTQPSPKYPDNGKIVDGKTQFSWSNMVGWDYPGKTVEIEFKFEHTIKIDSVSVVFLKSNISAVELPENGYNVYLKEASQYTEAYNASWEEFEQDTESDPIKNILAVSEKNGIGVFIGLGLNPEFWSGTFDVNEQISENKKLMTELYGLYKGYDSLHGWYLPEELEDRSFNTDARKEAVVKYLKAIKTYSKFLTKKPIILSPYFGMNPDGQKYGEWWDEILSQVNVDIIAMQDGVGTHRTTVKESTAVYKALEPIMKKHGVEFWANNEVFDQTHGWPVDTGSWKAEPATIERLIDQLKSMNPYVSKHIIFDFPHYMSPSNGGKSEELYNRYLNYINEEE